jgi:hypothetical protein
MFLFPFACFVVTCLLYKGAHSETIEKMWFQQLNVSPQIDADQGYSMATGKPESGFPFQEFTLEPTDASREYDVKTLNEIRFITY